MSKTFTLPANHGTAYGWEGVLEPGETVYVAAGSTWGNCGERIEIADETTCKICGWEFPWWILCLVEAAVIVFLILLPTLQKKLHKISTTHSRRINAKLPPKEVEAFCAMPIKNEQDCS